MPYYMGLSLILVRYICQIEQTFLLYQAGEKTGRQGEKRYRSRLTDIPAID